MLGGLSFASATVSNCINQRQEFAAGWILRREGVLEIRSGLVEGHFSYISYNGPRSAL
jgi:hypothetical protein